jgi:hypothetical protein
MSQVRENNVTYTTTQYATSQIPSRTVTNTYTTGGYTTGGQYASNLVGGQYSSNVVGGQSYYATTGPQYSTTDKLVNQTYQTTTGYSQIGQNLTQKVVAEEIPVESRIEYIPFEKKYIEYDQVERIERIPYEREIV